MNLRTALVVSMVFIACKKEEAAAPPPAAAPAAPAAGAPAKAEAKEGATITFTLAAPTVGTKFTSSTKNNLELTMHIEADEGKKIDNAMTSKEVGTYEVEYLEVDEDAPTKAKLHYTEKSDVDSEDGKEKKDKPSPVLNKTYVVALKGSDLVITDEKGKKVSKDEEAIIRDDCDFLGSPDAFQTSFPKKALKVGDEVPEVVEALQKVIADDAAGGGKDEPTVSVQSIKLKEDRGDVGVFEAGLKMAMADEEMHMTVDLKGNLEVRKKDTQLMKLELSGPVEMTAPPQEGMKMSGGGKMSLTMTRSP